MTSLLIRNVDAALHARLKEAAARHRRSMEEEARETLRGALATRGARDEENLADVAERIFGPDNGVDIDIPPRDAVPERPPPDFSGPEWDYLDGPDRECAGEARHDRR